MDPLCTILLIITYVGYGGIALSIGVPRLIQVEFSACLPIPFLVDPILVATQEIYCSIDLVSQIVDHDAPRLHQANEVPAPLEGLFLHAKYLEEIVQGFQMSLINCHT